MFARQGQPGATLTSERSQVGLRRQTRMAPGLLSLGLDGARIAASPNITPVRGLPSFPSLLGQEIVDGPSQG